MRQHGKQATYRHARCRCTECTEAHRVACAQGRERRIARLLNGQAKPEHGTSTTYRNYGCRCPQCVAANRQDCARRRAAMVAKAAKR